MNKKFGNKYYTLFNDDYIERKGLFKTKTYFYKDISKIYIYVPKKDNYERINEGDKNGKTKKRA